MSESTTKKCFIKAGFLSEDWSLVSFPKGHQEFDPFQELADGELVQVNSLLRDVSSRYGTDVPLAGEALKADYTLPMWAEMTANWEEEFFSSLSASTSQNSPHDDSDEDVIEVNAASKEPKVGLYIDNTCVPDVFSESPLNTDTMACPLGVRINQVPL